MRWEKLLARSIKSLANVSARLGYVLTQIPQTHETLMSLQGALISRVNLNPIDIFV